MSNFDIAYTALQAICPSNILLYDDKGFPSIGVKIPKSTWAELGVGTSTEPFPAFIVNGIEVDALYFSKYENIVQNACAYSLPAQDPAVCTPFDQAVASCADKGEGWHLATRLEQMAISYWCLKNGLLPKGNNDFGKDFSEESYKAIPSFDRGAGDRIHRVATGTGPLEWSHDRSKSGIYDLNGNVWEWQGGVRMVYGELQIISNDGITFGNDGADNENSQSETSALWRAIDGTTGALITPDSNGTTPKSLKLDLVNNHWEWITGIPKRNGDRNVECPFVVTTIDSTVCETAKHILQALGLYKVDVEGAAYQNECFIANNGAAESLFAAGGSYDHGFCAGLFAVNGGFSRLSAEENLGFRSCYIKSANI